MGQSSPEPVMTYWWSRHQDNIVHHDRFPPCNRWWQNLVMVAKLLMWICNL